MNNFEQYKKRMIELKSLPDNEAIHSEADDILCKMLIELGHEDIVETFKSLDLWYS